MPFSARNQRARSQIDNDCPETARIGLLHILHRMVEKDYASGWREVIAELQRIGRVMPDGGDHPDVAQLLLSQLEWDKVFDFCERLYSQLTRDVYPENGETGDWEIRTAKSKAQEYVANELQRLFLEEKLAFEFLTVLS